MRLHRTPTTAAFVLALAALALPDQARGEDTYEAPLSLRASQILPADLHAGPHHRVEETVRNDGYINSYVINSTFGTIPVQGTELLHRRVHEISALAAMDEVRQSEVFLEALGSAAMSPVRGAVDLVTDPVDTVTGAAKGVGKMFESIGHSIFGSPSEQEAGVIETVIGYDVQKRKIAFDYGVDPYSYNGLLQERLIELARAATVGGIGVKVGFSFIPGPGRLAVGGTSLTSQMNGLIRDKSPAELKSLNRDKLEAMGVGEQLTDVFLDHPKYSPSVTTRLVGALAALESVSGREAYIKRAALADSEVGAYLLQRRALMHVAYHSKVAPLQRFVTVNKYPFAQTQDGRLLVLVPLDYLTWSQETALVIEDMQRARDSLGLTGYDLWISGEVSPMARKMLETGGWRIVTSANAQLKPDE